MWIVVFLLNVYFVSGSCLNGGEKLGETCVCVDGYTGRHCQIKPYVSCAEGTHILDTSISSAVVNGTKYPVCDGTNDNCYYRPGVPESSKCLPEFGTCAEHFTADHNANCENGCTPDEFQKDCCIEHAKCEDHICPDTRGQNTNKERVIYNVGNSSWVITHLEDGACEYYPCIYVIYTHMHLRFKHTVDGRTNCPPPGAPDFWPGLRPDFAQILAEVFD